MYIFWDISSYSLTRWYNVRNDMVFLKREKLGRSLLRLSTSCCLAEVSEVFSKYVPTVDLLSLIFESRSPMFEFVVCR